MACEPETDRKYGEFSAFGLLFLESIDRCSLYSAKLPQIPDLE
jgi:hypothetical protein